MPSIDHLTVPIQDRRFGSDSSLHLNDSGLSGAELPDQGVTKWASTHIGAGSRWN